MNTKHLTTLLTLILAVAASAAARGGPPPRTPPADVIYLNGNIHTMDPSRPRAEALAVAGGRIVAVGSNADMHRLRRPETRVHDLDGKTVLPGLIDAHCHVASLGNFGLGRIDLSRARSFDDVVTTIAARIQTAEKGEWILGGRWDHESWPGRELPTHQKLSAVSPDNPVWLTRVDGHAGLAHAAAQCAAACPTGALAMKAGAPGRVGDHPDTDGG